MPTQEAPISSWACFSRTTSDMCHAHATYLYIDDQQRLRFCGLEEATCLPAHHAENARSGMPVILVREEDARLRSLYLVRQNGRPEQVWGHQDDLLDARQMENWMPRYTPVCRMCKHLLGALYDAFHIREMLEHEEALRTLEENVFRKSLAGEPDWKSCRGIALACCRENLGDTPLLECALAKLEKVSAPRKNKLCAEIPLDFLGYPLDLKISRDTACSDPR